MADTTIEALEGYASLLDEASRRSNDASQKQHLYIHGDAYSDVTTESGAVPTLAKQVVDAKARVDSALQDVAAQMAGGKTYTSIAVGLVATPEGGYFSVPSDKQDEYIVLYKKVSGAAVEVKRYPSVSALSTVTNLVQSYLSPLPETEYLALMDSESAGIASLTERRLATVPFEIISEGSSVVVGDSEGAAALYMDDERLMVGPLEVQSTTGGGIYVTDPEGALLQDLSSATQPVTSPFEGGLLFSPTIAVAEGGGSWLYLQSLLPRRDQIGDVVGSLASTTNSECATGNSLKITEAYGASAILNLRRVSAPNDRRFATVTIKKVPLQLTPVPVRVLFIGDSIGNRQGIYLLKSFLSALGFQPEFIGTLKSSSAVDAGNNDLGPLGEAREGWESGDFTYSITDRVQIVAPGEESTYLSSTKAVQWTYNPFLRQAISSDAPEVVKNGYVFDCAFYQQRFGFGVPDIVINALGTNDIRDRSQSTIYDHVYSNDLLIHKQILSAWPNAKIIRTIPGAAVSADRDVIWSDFYTKVIAAMKQAAKDFGSSSVHLAPLWAMSNPEVGYMLPTTAGDDGFLMGTWGDPIHPLGAARFGYYSAMAPFVAAAALNIL